MQGTTLALGDGGEVARHHCQVVLQWRRGGLGLERRPDTAEARLVELAILRSFAVLWGGVDLQEGARQFR